MLKTDLFPDENLFSKLCETIGDFNGVCMHLRHAFEVPMLHKIIKTLLVALFQAEFLHLGQA